MPRRGVMPGLTVVLVGDDPASAVYVGAKEKACARARHGEARRLRLPASTSQDELLAIVEPQRRSARARNPRADAAARSRSIRTRSIRRIRPDKDVDGFHPVNVGKLLIGEHRRVRAVHAGRRALHARAQRREDDGRRVRDRRTQQHRRQADGGAHGASAPVATRRSRSATADARSRGAHASRGHPDRRRRPAEMITGDMVKPGAVVIDVGMNRIPDATTKSGTRLVGDVHFAGAREVASLITPVPGGVGKMTIAMLHAEHRARGAQRAQRPATRPRRASARATRASGVTDRRRPSRTRPSSSATREPPSPSRCRR